MLPGLSSKIHLWEVSDVYVLSIMQESVAKVMEDSFVLKGLSEYRRSGSNRHAPFGAPDFESENPRPDASQYIVVCGLDKRKIGLLDVSFPFASGCVLASIAAALLPRNAGYPPAVSWSSLQRRLL
jgi:hypothetical protein